MKKVCQPVDGAYVNYRRFDGFNSISRTIMAQCYKGFGSSVQTQNGVIEKHDK